MLSFFHRFSVLNTAFSVIWKEISVKLSSIGGPWLTILYLWTLSVFFTEGFGGAWSDVMAIQKSRVAAACFLVSYSYLSLAARVRGVKYLNLIEVGFLRIMAKQLVKLTFPFVIWRYVWRPSERALRCLFCRYLGPELPIHWNWVLYAVAGTAILIVVRLCSRKRLTKTTVPVVPESAPPQRKAEPTAKVSRTRQPSARLARQRETTIF